MIMIMQITPFLILLPKPYMERYSQNHICILSSAILYTNTERASSVTPWRVEQAFSITADNYVSEAFAAKFREYWKPVQWYRGDLCTLTRSYL